MFLYFKDYTYNKLNGTSWYPNIEIETYSSKKVSQRAKKKRNSYYLSGFKICFFF